MNDDMVGTGLPFTKEDFRDLRDTIAAVKGLDEKIESGFKNTNEKIDGLATSIAACQTNCSGRRTRYNERLEAVEKAQEESKEKHVEERGFWKGRKADVALCASLGSFILIGIAIWRFWKELFP
jgi:hypothetical protein